MSTLRDDFCVLILSHGRADGVITLKTLKRLGYSGPWFIVIDDEDDQEAAYRAKYGEHVVQFCKQEIANRLDTPDLSTDHRCVVYARNASFDIAERLGYRYFLQLDDDYGSFQHRYEENGKLKIRECKQLDRLFESMLRFLDDSGALSVALGQGGDLLGGVNSMRWKKQLLRKAMNTFFCDTEKRFQFVGRINEDVNTYCLLGQQGQKFFSIMNVIITQARTQARSGGMSEMYLDEGTFVKSFYTVIYVPGAVSISSMGQTHKRMHHHVNWARCVPVIMSDAYRKP